MENLKLSSISKAFLKKNLNLFKTEDKKPAKISGWQKHTGKDESFIRVRDSQERIIKIPYIVGEDEGFETFFENYNIKELGWTIPEDYIVVDYDPRNDIDRDTENNALNKFKKDYGLDLEEDCNFKARTTRDNGMHFYYKCTQPYKPMGLYGGCLEILAKNKYVIIPQSTLPNNKQYKLLSPLENFENLNTFNITLQKDQPKTQNYIDSEEYKEASKRNIDQARDYILRNPCTRGNRDNTLYKQGARCLDFGLTNEQAVNLIKECNHHSERQSSLEEIQKKVDNVFKYAKRFPQLNNKQEMLAGNEHIQEILMSEGLITRSNIKDTIQSVKIILENHTSTKDLLYFDTFFGSTLWFYDPEFSLLEESESEKLPLAENLSSYKKYDINNPTTHARFMMLIQKFIPSVKPDNVEGALNIITSSKKMNCIRRVFDESLPIWDKKQRLEELFIKYLGVEDSAYNRYMTRYYLCKCVERFISDNSTEFHEIIILSGDEGLGKSWILKNLWLGDSFFTDRVNFSDYNQFCHDTKGKLLVEWAELVGNNGIQSTRLKSLLSQATDSYRPIYCKHNIDRPRRFAIAGTTNHEKVLRDTTGSRRFIMLKCTLKTNREEFLENIHQIQAEAYHYVKSGDYEKFINDVTHKKQHNINKESQYFGDEGSIMLEEIKIYVLSQQRTSKGELRIGLKELIEYLFPDDIAYNVRSSPHTKNISKFLRHLGFKAKLVSINSKNSRRWCLDAEGVELLEKEEYV